PATTTMTARPLGTAYFAGQRRTTSSTPMTRTGRKASSARTARLSIEPPPWPAAAPAVPYRGVGSPLQVQHGTGRTRRVNRGGPPVLPLSPATRPAGPAP